MFAIETIACHPLSGQGKSLRICPILIVVFMSARALSKLLATIAIPQHLSSGSQEAVASRGFCTSSLNSVNVTSAYGARAV